MCNVILLLLNKICHLKNLMQSFVGLLVCEKNVDRNTFCMKHDNILYKECTSVVAFTTL